jgi:hypothetical protein
MRGPSMKISRRNFEFSLASAPLILCGQASPLRARVELFLESPKHKARRFDDVPYLAASAGLDNGSVVLNVVNRHPDQAIETTVELEDKQFSGPRGGLRGQRSRYQGGAAGAYMLHSQQRQSA